MDTSELLESLFDAIPDVIGIQDRHHGIIRYNAAGYKFLNMTHKETEGKKCYELIGRSTPCDIWNCGRHRVMCGDSTSHANLQLLLDGGKADMVFTDPPYLMNFTGSPPSKTGGKRVIVFTYHPNGYTDEQKKKHDQAFDGIDNMFKTAKRLVSKK